MDNFVKRTWAEINMDAICHNLKEIRKKVSNQTKIMCVVKADAYGHGAKCIAMEFEKQGADWFAVSNIEEAIQLRDYGINKPILVLGYTPCDMVEKLYNFNISQAILSYNYGVKISDICKEKGIKIKGHLKIDTGMNRIGFSCQSQEEIEKSVNSIAKLNALGQIDIEGAFTHFAVSDSPKDGKEFTQFQFRNFKETVKKLEQTGMHIKFKHCCNSGGIMCYTEMELDMVRAGIILYGLLPDCELKGKINLRPVMELKTVISQIKTINKGQTVSYGRIFTAGKDIKVATVPIGYADGYSRRFSNKAYMVVCGKRAPIIGRVCMDQLMLDITGIDEAKEGDEVVVFGKQGDEEISVWELANIADTIGYEIVCLIGKRVPRIYYKNGQKMKQLSYM